MSVEAMGFAVAIVAWMFPTRVIRSQVLSLRERSYVEVARANGVGPWGLIFKEVMPNAMPWVVAAFVAWLLVRSWPPLDWRPWGWASNDTHTLGVNIYWAQYYTAIARGMWWWWRRDPDDRVHLAGPVHHLLGHGPHREPPAPARLAGRGRDRSVGRLQRAARTDRSARHVARHTLGAPCPVGAR